MGKINLAGILLFSVFIQIVAQGTNSIQNGGFENGTAYWNTHDGTVDIVSSNPHNGANCLKIEDNCSDSVKTVHCDRFAINGDKWYEVKFWARGTNNHQNVYVLFHQLSSDTSSVAIPHGDVGYKLEFEVDTQWTLCRDTIFSFWDDADYLIAQFFPTNPEYLAHTGTAYFDDITFTEIAPNTVADGYWLARNSSVEIWQSPIEQKVRPNMVPPRDSIKDGIEIYSAKGEYESFQVVLKSSLSNGDRLNEIVKPELKNESDGTVLSDTLLNIKEVAYLNVTKPTDYKSFGGMVPDPLPEIEYPMQTEDASTNQKPVWFTIHMPLSIPSGTYQDTITFVFEQAGEVKIPIKVNLWNFELPEFTSFRSSYKICMHTINEYHQLALDEQNRKVVYRNYLEDFKKHRINPRSIERDCGFDTGDDIIRVDFRKKSGEIALVWHGANIEEDPDSAGNPVMALGNISEDNQAIMATCNMVEISQGMDYQLSMRAKVQSDSACITYFQFDENRIQINHSSFMIYHENGEWQDVVETIAMFDQTKYMEVRLSPVWPLSNLGKSLFDDVVLSPVNGSGMGFEETFDPINPDSIDIDIDFSEFREAADYALDDLGFNSFELLLPYFAQGGGSVLMKSAIAGNQWGTQGYLELFSDYFGRVAAFLEDNSWKDKAYVYWVDEAQPSLYDTVIAGMQMLHDSDPTIKRLMTINHTRDAALNSNVDIWVPGLNRYDKTWADERQNDGDEMWWYTCCGPKAPYPNYFIDHMGVEPRIRPWINWKYNVEGDLYWCVNYYPTPDPLINDPWTDPMSSGPVYNWGNGDGRLVYPPKDWRDGRCRLEGPTSSIRWELIREGMEDYDYFCVLKNVADSLITCAETREDTLVVERARELLTIPDYIIENLKSFTKNPGLLHKRRIEIGNLLDSIYRDYRIDGLEVYVKDEGWGDNSYLKPRIYIQNNSADTISDFKVYYYFSTEDASTTPIHQNWFVPSTEVNLQRINDTSWCVIYDFSDMFLNPGQVYPDYTGSVIGVHYSDWSAMDKDNDFTQCGAAFEINDKVAIFDSNQRLIYGSTPGHNVTPPAITVYSKDDGLADCYSSKPCIYLKSNGEEISDFTIMYYFTTESGKTPSLQGYYLPYCTASLEALSNNEYRVVLDYTGFTLPATADQPSQSISQIGLHYTDWSEWDCGNDHSFNNSANYRLNNRIEVYDANGQRIYGTR